MWDRESYRLQVSHIQAHFLTCTEKTNQPAAYRNGICSRQRDEKVLYTNDLHKVLFKKKETTFWKCLIQNWNTKEPGNVAR